MKQNQKIRIRKYPMVSMLFENKFKSMAYKTESLKLVHTKIVYCRDQNYCSCYCIPGYIRVFSEFALVKSVEVLGKRIKIEVTKIYSYTQLSDCPG